MKLYVAGVHLNGPGYPNAARTLKLLERQPALEIIELGAWLPDHIHLWRLVKGPRWRAGLQLGRLLLGNATSLVRVLHAQRKSVAPVYVPYPSLFFLWFLSWVPSRWRPFCIADAYISVWDSLFRDRSGERRNGLASRLLWGVESRALRAAARVLVDTQANRECLIADFGLAPARVQSLPLAIDEHLFTQNESPARASDGGVLRVLFVGTLIPLHGTAVVLEAMRLLRNNKRIEFRFVGDGQLGHLVEEFAVESSSSSFSWVRNWLPLREVAAEISEADICLGIFGGDSKAARVLPFKLYMYLAAGKPIISQGSLSTPRGAPYPPIYAVNSISGRGLADAISGLIDDPERRNQLSQAASSYYRSELSNARVAAHWDELLRTGDSQGPS